MADVATQTVNVLDEILVKGGVAAGTELIQFLPNIFVAIVILLVGWLVSVIFAKITGGLLRRIRLEEIMKKYRIEDALGSVKISTVIEKIVKYYVIIIFLQAAVEVLGIVSINEFLRGVLFFAPVAIGAFGIFALSAVVGEFIKERIIEFQPKSKMVLLSGRGAKALIVFLGIMVGLQTIGFNTAIVNQAFISILQSFGFAVALAFGLAFGFGGQDDAKDLIRKLRKKVGV